MRRERSSPAPQARAALAAFAARCALGLAAATLPPWCAAGEPAPAGANARLEALRSALTDKALKAPTRVRSAAWLDESGTLHENLQIHSDIKLRGIRVLSYLEDAGALRADLVADAAAALAANNGCPQALARFRRHAALVETHAPGDASLGYHFLPELADYTAKFLIRVFSQDEGWVVTPAAVARSAYERTLLGTDTPAATPYVMRLSLEALKLPPVILSWAETPVVDLFSEPSRRVPVKPLLLTLRVEERSTGRALWQHEAPFHYPESEADGKRQPLPAGLTQALEHTLLDWRAQMGEALRCEPLQFAVAVPESGELTVHAGSRSGVRVGDHLLLVDRTRVPGSMLEAGALDRAALFQVQSIATDRSVAKRVAGPAPSGRSSDLVAMPL